MHEWVAAAGREAFVAGPVGYSEAAPSSRYLEEIDGFKTENPISDVFPDTGDNILELGDKNLL